MKQETKEWVAKAERDFATMKREFRVAEDANYDDVCFHAQQCIEKLLKGYLQELEIEFPRSHDLRELLNLLLPTHATWTDYIDDCARLSEYAVSFRYPGETAERSIAERAMNLCVKLRGVILDRLNPEGKLPFPT